MLDQERNSFRKFRLAQKIDNNTKLIGALVYYIANLVPGQWTPLKPPRRPRSRKLSAAWSRHLTAARRVLKLLARKRFSADGRSCTEYYLSLSYEAHLRAAIGLDLYDPCTRAAFDALPSSFRLCDLQGFADNHPRLLERTKAFLAKDYLRANERPCLPWLPAPPVISTDTGRVMQTEYEQQRREAWLNRNFSIEL